MNRNLAALLILATAGAARADTLTGMIDDAGLRRKVELVYVEKAEGTFEAKPAIMNQKGNTYLPHILPVVAGAKVTFTSEDAELHNVYARQSRKSVFNQAVLPNGKFDKVIATPGFIHLTCNIHKEMSAWVVVLQNPYFAKPDPKTGKFEIAGVPPGRYTVRTWGEELSDEEKEKKFEVEVKTGNEPLRVALR